MEENGNPPVKDPASSVTKIPVTTVDNDQGDGSNDKPKVDKQSEAYRNQQSRADKAQNDGNEMAERLEFLEGIAGDQIRDQLVGEFISEKSKDYPNVSAADLKRFASSPDELEETAKFLQDKHDEIKQSTLAEARNVPDGSMTVAEKKTALEAVDPSIDRNAFKKWFGIQSAKTRK